MAENTSPVMGELTDIANRLVRQLELPELKPGVFQGSDCQLSIEQRPGEEQLAYKDKVCSIAFQYLDNTRQVHYTLKPQYLSGQLELLGESETGLGRLIADDLVRIHEKSNSNEEGVKGYHSLIGLKDFSEVEQLIRVHYLS